MGRNEALKALADYATELYNAAPDKPDDAATSLAGFHLTMRGNGMEPELCEKVEQAVWAGLQATASGVAAMLLDELGDGAYDEAEAREMLGSMVERAR